MIILILIILGVCFGSFVNALVWRLHKQEAARSKKAKAQYSVSHGRSMCTHCKHVLAPQDLIPVFSYVALRGRCRYCGKLIQDSPLAELLVPFGFVLSLLWWPTFGTEQVVLFGFWLAYLVLFVALAIYDLRWRLLPNKLVAVVAALVVVQYVVQLIFFDLSLTDLGLGLAAALIGGGIFWMLFQVSAGRWIGGGDVKLGFVLGLILARPSLALLYIFVASLLGTFVALPGLLFKRLTVTTQLPFGPYLLVAAVLTHLFGQGWIDWYLRFTGL